MSHTRLMSPDRPGPTRFEPGAGREAGRIMLRFAAVLLLLSLAGCGGGEDAPAQPSQLSLSPEQVQAIKAQDEAIEEEEGGAFKRRVEARAKGKTTRP